MPANQNPIFTAQPDIQWNVNPIMNANNRMDGDGTMNVDIFPVFTADANNGGFVHKVVARPRGTNVATVLRIFINNGGVNGGGAANGNNVLYGEMSLPATTASASGSQPPYEYPMNIALPAGYRLLVQLGTAVAAGYSVSVVGGKY